MISAKKFGRSDELINEFVNTIKDKYPNLTNEQLVTICRAPFKTVANEMRSGNLFNIRIKYLGNFCIYPGRVKGLLAKTVQKYEKGLLTEARMLEVTDKAIEYFKFHIKK